jgi:acetyl-CoA decarbonylase/synthase complex subunit gamma
MALTPLDVLKHLPKTNCKKCGFPTCFVFAMQLANKKVSLDKCPEISEEGKAALGAASAPPIATVTIGRDEPKLVLGNETVLFRHEETFYHPPGLAIEVSDTEPAKLEQVKKLCFERVGQQLKVELVALRNDSGEKAPFLQVAKKALELKLGLILIASRVSIFEEVLPEISSARPVLYTATEENYQEMSKLAQTFNCPLTVSAPHLDALSQLTQKVNAVGVRELILDLGGLKSSSLLSNLTQIRRLALKKRFRALGYPVLIFASSDDIYKEVVRAIIGITKYAGIIILKHAEAWETLPLLTLRQNIYTDPQKPLQVEPKVYEVGKPNSNSPFLITTNFSLTYFTVEGDVEASKTPAYIAAIDTEGMSVLTAWAAEKFTPAKIAACLKEPAVKKLVSHHKAIIPGHVAVLSGELEELSGWKILVGPRESSGIPRFLKHTWQA